MTFERVHRLIPAQIPKPLFEDRVVVHFQKGIDYPPVQSQA